jgi:hypothetical protein
VRVPIWDGKEKTFHMWWMQYTNFAEARGFEDALYEERIKQHLPPTSNEEFMTDQQERARKQNADAMFYFIMAFQTDEAAKHMYRSMPLG